MLIISVTVYTLVLLSLMGSNNTLTKKISKIYQHLYMSYNIIFIGDNKNECINTKTSKFT